ncbi:hypothetical protein BBJ28_00007663 [Nothophytophthora sp. Chile5]|nr:hypothetical protein BBJ28_00007663 [Nothophytophthora sp. Chile5]
MDGFLTTESAPRQSLSSPARAKSPFAASGVSIYLANHTKGLNHPVYNPPLTASGIMMRIADLLNNVGEDDSQLASAAVRLGRSVSAPVQEAKADDNADHEMAMEDEHAVSCPEDKRSPRHVPPSQASARYGSYSRKQAKTSMKRSPRMLSPSASQQQFMTIRSIVNPGEPTEDSGDLLGSGKQAAIGKKRSTRSLFPEVSDTDRRAKQRLIVKRCYYKKIVRFYLNERKWSSQLLILALAIQQNTIKSLRNEANGLEQQFRTALRARQQEGEVAKAAGHGDDLHLRELFIDTLSTKESLREENVRLRRLADEYYMKNQGRLRQLLDSNQKGLILFTAASNEE